MCLSWILQYEKLSPSQWVYVLLLTEYTSIWNNNSNSIKRNCHVTWEMYVMNLVLGDKEAQCTFRIRLAVYSTCVSTQDFWLFTRTPNSTCVWATFSDLAYYGGNWSLLAVNDIMIPVWRSSGLPTVGKRKERLNSYPNFIYTQAEKRTGNGAI